MSQKMDVGKVFSRIFELYTSQASVYLPAALIIYLPYALITGAVLTGTGGLFLALLIFALLFVTVFIYQGIVVRSVEDLQDGQRARLAPVGVLPPVGNRPGGAAVLVAARRQVLRAGGAAGPAAGRARAGRTGHRAAPPARGTATPAAGAAAAVAAAAGLAASISRRPLPARRSRRLGMG